MHHLNIISVRKKTKLYYKLLFLITLVVLDGKKKDKAGQVGSEEKDR